MRSTTVPAAALTLASVFLAGCREHNEPAKPITELSANVTGSSSQLARQAGTQPVGRAV